MKEIGRRKFLIDAYKNIIKYSRVLNGEIQEQEPREIEMPIYSFHEVRNEHVFSAFVLELAERGFQPTSLSTLYDYFQTGENKWWGNPFILSFDDGLLSQKRNAFPFLKKYKVPAVFAVMPNWGGDEVHEYMTNDDYRELASEGMEVISHTLNHAHLPSLRQRDRGAWLMEIIKSQQNLSVILGQDVDSFCYPYGAYDKETVDLVSQYYKLSLSTRPGTIQKSNEAQILKRSSKS